MNRATREWVAFDEQRRRTRNYDADSPQPFRDAAGAYRAAGWSTVFHLPPGDKKPPPEGFTGRDGEVPGDELIEHWRDTEAAGNIGGRVPKGYLGIDVDNYGEYRGAADLEALEDKLGPLPPADKTSSRGPDDPSGIRLYRIPEGIEFPGKPEGHEGIQFIQHHHRYVVLPPSIHPEGRRYVRYGPGGKPFAEAKPLSSVLELPAAWVREFGTKAKARDNGKAKLSTGELHDMLAGMPEDGGELCRAMSDRLKRGLSDCASVSKGGRHDDIVGGEGNHVFALARMGEQGHTGVRTALSALRDAFVTAVEADRTGGAEEAHAEFDRAVAGALKKIAADPTPEAKLGCCGTGDPNWFRTRGEGSSDGVPSPADHPLWQARQALTVIRDFALSRRTSPWAVLGVALGRVIVATSPRVVLPAIIGEEASLNFFLGLVSDSGGGKGSSMRVGRRVVRWNFDTGLTEHTVGSGQGIAHAYARRLKGGGYEMHTTQAILSVEEVDHFNQKHAQGSTLMAELRRFYMGESLGHLYVDPNKRIEVPEHAYRGALIVGIQPERAGVLLDDGEQAAGTPQRFVWLPADYPHHPDERPPEVPAFRWNKPRDVPGPGQERVVVDVCATAWDEIDTFHLHKARGQADPLDGHLLLCREKVAAALGLLDGRLSIIEEDWQLAGEVIDLSNQVRGYVIEVLADRQRSVRQARSEERVEEEVAKVVAIQTRRTIDGARKLTQIVREEPGVTLRGTRDRMRSWRDLLHECLDHAKAEQWIVEETEASHTDKSKRVLRPGPRRPS